jgi:hypothetical protein
MHSDFLPDNPTDSATSGQLQPFELLAARADDVIGEWRRMLEREPWARLPAERVINHLPRILPELFRHAAHGARQIDPDLQQMISKAHGYFRRQDSVPLAAVAEEFDVLKRACWKVLVTSGLSEAAISSALARLDILIDDATGYTLRGYYAPELDALRGRGLERRTSDRPPPPENRRR